MPKQFEVEFLRLAADMLRCRFHVVNGYSCTDVASIHYAGTPTARCELKSAPGLFLLAAVEPSVSFIPHARQHHARSLIAPIVNAHRPAEPLPVQAIDAGSLFALFLLEVLDALPGYQAIESPS